MGLMSWISNACRYAVRSAGALAVPIGVMAVGVVALGVLAVGAMGLDRAAAQSPFGASVAEVRLAPSGVSADGRRWATLHVDLAPGWRTYWRSPGEAGIPPWFDWSGATNVRDVEIVWPAPTVSHSFGMTTIGYDRTVSFPIAFRPETSSAPSLLQGEVRLAVCEEICIPVHAEVAASVAPDAGQSAPTDDHRRRLAAAPRSGPAVDAAFHGCSVNATADGPRLAFAIAAGAIEAPRLGIIEGGPGELLGLSRPLETADGLWVFATAIKDERPTAPILTVIGASDAIEVRGCRLP